MTFTTPVRLLRYLEKNNTEFWWNYRNSRSKYTPGPYNRNYIRPEYGFADIEVVDGVVRINKRMSGSTCRGWCYEAWLASLRRNRSKKKTGTYSDVNIHNAGVTLIFARSSRRSHMRQGIALLNELETKAGWAKTVMYEDPKYPHMNLLIGSKNWMYNLPLLSAFMLIPRQFVAAPLKGGESIEKYLERISKPTYGRLAYGSDAHAFVKALEDDLLLTLMRHRRHITGKDRYKSIDSMGVGHVHDTGIGNFSDKAHIVRAYWKKRALMRNTKAKKELNKVNAGISHLRTTAVHEGMLERTIRKLGPKPEAKAEKKKVATK